MEAQRWASINERLSREATYMRSRLGQRGQDCILRPQSSIGTAGKEYSRGVCQNESQNADEAAENKPNVSILSSYYGVSAIREALSYSKGLNFEKACCKINNKERVKRQIKSGSRYLLI